MTIQETNLHTPEVLSLDNDGYFAGTNPLPDGVVELVRSIRKSPEGNDWRSERPDLQRLSGIAIIGACYDGSSEDFGRYYDEALRIIDEESEAAVNAPNDQTSNVVPISKNVGNTTAGSGIATTPAAV